MKKTIFSVLAFLLMLSGGSALAFPGAFYSGNGGTVPVATTFQEDVTIGSTTAGKNLTVYGSGTFTFATGVDVEIGRGTSDTDITYLSLRSANGTLYYIYPDNSGALILSTTKP